MTISNLNRQNLNTELVAQLRRHAADYEVVAGKLMDHVVAFRWSPEYVQGEATLAAHYGRMALVFRDSADALEQADHNVAGYRELLADAWAR